MKRTIMLAAILAGFLSFLCRTELSWAKEDGTVPSPAVTGPVAHP